MKIKKIAGHVLMLMPFVCLLALNIIEFGILITIVSMIMASLFIGLFLFGKHLTEKGD